MKWHIFTRGTIPYMRTYLYHESIRETYNNFFNIPDFTMVYLNIGERMYWAWDREQMIHLGKQLLNWQKDEDKKLKHYSLLQKYVNQSINSSNYIISLNLKNKSDDELIQLAYSHYKEIQGLYSYLGVLIDAIDIFPVEYLRDLIVKRINSKDAIKTYNELVSPIYTSYLIEEENEFLKIVAKIKNNNLSLEDVKDDLNNIMQKYWWTEIGGENMQLRTKEDFIEVLKNYIKEYPNPKEHLIKPNFLTKLRERRVELVKQYKLEDINYLLEAFDFYTEMHELRKEGQVKSIYAMHLIQKEMASRIDVLEEDIQWFSFREASQFLKNKNFDKEMCELRKIATLEYVIGSKSTMKFGDDAIQFEKDEFDQEISEVKEIQGTPASLGKTKGIVKVCNGAKEAIPKIEKGDILVCGMTLPEYVPAMKKAAAIITDEGGITCHAAIISRELNIPCIIGTKIAQKILKDGMEVKVDADIGVVRLL